MKFIPLLILIHASIFANNSKSPLEKCYEIHSKLVNNQFVTLYYTEKNNELSHSFNPWDKTLYIKKGEVNFNASLLSKTDSIINQPRIFHSISIFNDSNLIIQDYGEKIFSEQSNSEFTKMYFNSSRYTPTLLLNYFIHKKNINKSETEENFIYQCIINQSIVKLIISKKNYYIQKIEILQHNDLFGDVSTIYYYSNFKKIKQLVLPFSIKIEKINGKVEDQIEIESASILNTKPNIFKSKTDYKHYENQIVTPSISTTKFNENLYLLELKHTDDRVLIVEFSDFLLVAEAPLNSENGELIINEAKKIAPYKPIKYFVFGHFHEHYIGGIRPFIAEGATIICSPFNKDYMKYIVDAKHTLSPDRLETYPKPLNFNIIQDSLVISDENNEMKIFLIGKKSEHTIDYLIYYFPKEKILFQDDLVWIKRDAPITKARGRQAGLYQSIKDLNLEVKTIIQSWPVSEYGVKTIIPFEDLESSMKIK